MTGVSRNERIKEESAFLRGALREELDRTQTGTMSEDDQQIVKFHGMYLQDDRDLRSERMEKKLEKAFSFMIRLRIPGGVCTPEQWLQLDRIAQDYAGNTLRLTTRQSVQFHGVLKSNLKTVLKQIDSVSLDTLAACGDVNRNVVACARPRRSDAHRAAYDLARALSERLLPRTCAYREIWLDGERVAGNDSAATEPLYGRTYLPRKFKIGIAVPPDNDIDVFAHDLGFVAVVDAAGKAAGWNVTVGGGMGMTHGEASTYPRLADILGFCLSDDACALAEAVVTVQRDWGDRSDRRHARLKYTIENRGLEAFRAEVEHRFGKRLETAREFAFERNGDRYGWARNADGTFDLTLFIESGRVKDHAGGPQVQSALRRIAKRDRGELRLTANQNIAVANVSPEMRSEIDGIVADAGMAVPRGGLRQNSLACVGLPSCGLALAESERYLPDLLRALDARLASHGLADEEITIRLTGCPNGCARPYLAEIGLVGRSPGRYNLYLAGGFDGSRLAKPYAEDLCHDTIVEALDPLFAAYAGGRLCGERFGDFLIRSGYVARTANGPAFHAVTGPRRGPAPED